MQITDITPIKGREYIINFAAYCRVSSDSSDQLHSFAAQIKHFRDYEKNNPRYKLFDIYADEGLSGTEMEKRTELNRMIIDCQKGKIDKVVTKSVSRFARNTEDLLSILRMLKSFGVSVYFEEQGIDTEKLNMEMIVTFPGMAAQQESETISGNLRWGIKRRMESGEYVCSNPPFGYELKDKQSVICDNEAKVVKRIFNLYLNGMGTRQIAELFNKEKVPRPIRSRSSLWCRRSIVCILKNDKYTGNAMLNKSYMMGEIPFKKKINYGERPRYYVENYCPPIIDKESFNIVQTFLKTKTCRKGVENETYTLSRTLYCSECGRAFRRQVVNGKVYWLCEEKAGTEECSGGRVKEEAVYETFTLLTYKLKEYRTELIENTIKKLELLQFRLNGNGERIRRIDREIGDLSAKNLVITRLYSGGILNTSEYAAQSDEINNMITELRIKRKKEFAENEKWMSLNELRCLNEVITEYIPNGEFDEELFKEIVEKIMVNGNRGLMFILSGGLEFTEEISAEWRCKRNEA